MWKIKIVKSLAICAPPPSLPKKKTKKQRNKERKKIFILEIEMEIIFISFLIYESRSNKNIHIYSKVFYIYYLCYALLSADIDRHIYSMGNSFELDGMVVVYALVFRLNVLNVRNVEIELTTR